PNPQKIPDGPTEPTATVAPILRPPRGRFGRGGPGRAIAATGASGGSDPIIATAGEMAARTNSEGGRPQRGSRAPRRSDGELQRILLFLERPRGARAWRGVGSERVESGNR